MTRESGPFEVSFQTEAGPRPENQDAAVTARLPDGRLLVAVADGMGGLKAGAEASRRALTRLATALRDGTDLVGAVRSAHAAVQELAETDAAGSTVAAALLSPGGVEVAHVGDSRAYRCGGMGLVPLTRDHTVASEAEARGELAAREVAGSRWGATLARALGTAGAVEPDVLSLPPLEAGEWLVLTTDGVHGVLSDEVIERTVSGASDPAAAAAALVSGALAGGTDDNLSAVVVRRRVAPRRASGTPEAEAAPPEPPVSLSPKPRPMALSAESGLLASSDAASASAPRAPDAPRPPDTRRPASGAKASRRSTGGPSWDPSRMVRRSSNTSPRRRWFVPGIFIGVAVVAVVLVAIFVL